MIIGHAVFRGKREEITDLTCFADLAEFGYRHTEGDPYSMLVTLYGCTRPLSKWFEIAEDLGLDGIDDAPADSMFLMASLHGAISNERTKHHG